MQYFPVFAELTDKPCLIVGAGEVAHRRVELLLRAGARLTVLAPDISPALWPLAADGRIRIEQRAFDDTALEPYWLVIAATDDPTVNRRVADAAHAAKRLCNVVDDRELSTFIVPAIVDRHPVTITVSTAGASPVLARWIKGLIESVVPARTGHVAALLQSWRDRVKAAIPNLRDRRRFWEIVVAGDVAGHELAGRADASRVAFERLLAEWTNPAAGSCGAGEAFIVGAGPGAPDLITLRGRQLLATADVVLHDRLVNPQILEFARREAQIISVGKSPHKSSITQDEINIRLVELVRAGNRVCRLKGGDPMIFGHVAEEIEALIEAELPFQIVPGVSAVEGCAAYAGIPLTWRGLAQSVLIMTGHTESGATGDSTLAGTEQTIAIYMAARRCKAVACTLIERGLTPSTPAAIIENGTLETQRITRTTLAALASPNNPIAIESPALLLVGHAVGRAQAFSWFQATQPCEANDADHGAARVS
jgi:uroporphyrin-III C-methyltransferase/precorrin-2 dehydrogenase/sirohydrochlorin ferrochelatase